METAALSRAGSARHALQLVAAGVLLDWCVNVRLPAHTAATQWLLPSPEIAVLLALFALFAPRPSWQLPRALGFAVCALLLGVRVGRIADGISQRYLDRRFHLASDLPLVPEFGRLALSTLGPVRFGLALALLLTLVATTWLLTAAALRVLARALSNRRGGNIYLVTVAVLAVLGPLLAPTGTLFLAPVAPRMIEEFELWLTARGLFDDPAHAAQRQLFTQRFRERQAKLRAAATTLERTGKVDVHIVLVEAYGRTVQSTPAYAALLAPSYDGFTREIERAGFSVCTAFVRATTFGGSSWLTHATLESAVAMRDQFDYTMFLEQRQIASLAKAFRSAGYRSISVKPGTTRASPETTIYGYDREYSARDLNYHGPGFAWATMPDQFVLQRTAELELRHLQQPLYAFYALISSHFPFNPHPRFIDDWTSLGDGSVWKTLPTVQFREPQATLSVGTLGYLSSISYDLRATSQFITRYARGDALVLVLGDHQPIAPVAGDDHSRATPLHVLSRRSALLDRFRARGCVPGMLGGDAEPQLTMEDLGITLLSILSESP